MQYTGFISFGVRDRKGREVGYCFWLRYCPNGTLLVAAANGRDGELFGRMPIMTGMLDGVHSLDDAFEFVAQKASAAYWRITYGKAA